MSASSVAKIGREIRADISKTLRDVMLLACENLIAANPVDTGHSRNNWILSTGSPYNGIDGSNEDPSDAAQRAGIEKIANYDVAKHGAIFLRNNVLYVQFLDAGSSQQAEAGYVAESFINATAAARHGRKTSARKMLKNMARQAYRKGI